MRLPKYDSLQDQLGRLSSYTNENGEFEVYTGIDLAVQTHAAADRTVLFTVLRYPKDGTRHVINIESGRWDGPTIINKIISCYQRYGGQMIVENNAGQDWIRQFTLDKAVIPLTATTTGRNKAHPEFGLEGLFAEMAAGKWVIPNRAGEMHPEIEAWVQEMLFYDPKDHTGDRLMASWFAQDKIRQRERRGEGGSVKLEMRSFGAKRRRS